MTEYQKAPWPDWETVRIIGRGSFGTVYEIQRKLVDGDTERAALKVITIPQNPGDIEEMYSEGYDDESITATFQSHLKSIVAEYSLMQKMEGSANIVNCKDIRYIQHDNGIGWDIYLRMELLTPLLKALPADTAEETVVKIGRDICKALVLCKRHGIVHRDIKPQNIFVSDNGDYKLGDFGIAKTVEKTMGGTKIGTYKYMAPEVYNNQPYGSGADIYSLGLVLYWMLNERRMPFLPLPPAKLSTGMDEEARFRRFSGEPIPAPRHGSEELKRIVLKACAYDPADRYQSAAEMLADLQGKEGAADAPSVPLAAAAPAENDNEATVCVWQEDAKNLPEEDKDATIGVFSKKEDTTERDASPEETAHPAEESIPPEESPVPEETASGKPETPLKRKSGKKRLLAVAAAAACLLIIGGIITAVRQKNRQDIVAVSAGSYHTVGLKSDGTVVVVGLNKNGQCDVGGWRDIVAISAGYYHTVGLKSDGTVVAVGDNEYGQCEVSGWRDIVAISAGSYHTVGLKSDGTVVAVGWKKYGQCEVSGWQDIVAISAGRSHTVGLKRDGTVVAVGANSSGQCEVSGWQDIVAISAGRSHTVGLKSDSTVVAVGWEKYGPCDVSSWQDIVAVSAGNVHTIGLKSDGTAVAVGDNDLGQCDVSNWRDIKTSAQNP